MTDPRLPDHVLRYADHADGVLDVHLPRATTTRDVSAHQMGRLGAPDGTSRRRDKVVMLLHGGFWKQEWDRTHTRNLARALADEGHVVATPEYRRVGGGGGWPTTCEDVGDALAALPDLLGTLGVQLGPVDVVGHSAGGHLALWLASEPVHAGHAPPRPHPRIGHVVALAPVSDLRAAAARHLGDDATQRFMGGPPDEVDYDPADPMIRLARRPDCAVTVIHGSLDDAVPLGLSRDLVTAHPWIRLVQPQVGHYELIDPAGATYPTLLEGLKGS
ncbi:alpha/beta hydrolase family protein [Nocardioides terrisoli]|uniref:alpha/beta hydrolase family protein n=1 Tax=Nocardioides terrisoli TaxID=3388267 RepID=UPI00287BAA49|nr:alpha/beta hydrolase [Nocardioides marmorisolisilvae]